MKGITTNEAGEIIILDTPVAKKTRKKKKEEEQLYVPPFFSEEYFKFLISNNGLGDWVQQQTNHLLLKWNNEEYLPLYSLKYTPPGNIPYHEYNIIFDSLNKENPIIDVLDNEYIRIIKNLKSIDPIVHKYFKHLWLTKNYRLLSEFSESYINKPVGEDFKNKAKEILFSRNENFLKAGPDLSISVPHSSYGRGTPRLIGKFKYHNEWCWTMVKQQSAHWDRHPMYLSNLGFIAKQYDWSTRVISGGLRPIKPLVCIVFKKEHFSLIKHYIIANEPIPGELLQLWVDKGLEDANSNLYNIRASYIRQIRNPYKKFGIEVVIKDSLVDSLFYSPKLKKFKTFIEQKNWVDIILKEFNEAEKKNLKIS